MPLPSPMVSRPYVSPLKQWLEKEMVEDPAFAAAAQGSTAMTPSRPPPMQNVPDLQRTAPTPSSIAPSPVRPPPKPLLHEPRNAVLPAFKPKKPAKATPAKATPEPQTDLPCKDRGIKTHPSQHRRRQQRRIAQLKPSLAKRRPWQATRQRAWSRGVARSIFLRSIRRPEMHVREFNSQTRRLSVQGSQKAAGIKRSMALHPRAY